MNGSRSARPRDLPARMTVENCLTIEAHSLVRQGIHLEERIHWNGRRIVTIQIMVEPIGPDLAHLRLAVDCEWSGDVQYLYLTTTSPRFGGIRHWFICPTCERRCAKLHLPPKAGEFQCRLCHDLTYKSCQMSRMNLDLVAIAAGFRRSRERLMKRMGIHLPADIGAPPQS